MDNTKSAPVLSRRLSALWVHKLMDTLMTPVALLLGAIVLFFAWLLWITRGRRPVQITFRGLGVELHIDAKHPAPNTPVKGEA